jgi:MFS family permease
VCGKKPISAGGRTRLLVIFTGTYFIAALAVLSFAPLLPFIQEDLLLDKTHLGFFISAAYLGAMLSGFPYGWMADRCGVIPTISVGLVIQGVFLAITAAISSFFWMIFAVFIAGAGFGAVNPATSKGIINWFPVELRSTAMAVKQMGFTAGAMGTAAILPASANSIGWRSAVFLVAVFVFLCGIVTYFIYPSEIRKNDGPQKHYPSPARPLAMQTAMQSIWKHNQILF